MSTQPPSNPPTWGEGVRILRGIRGGLTQAQLAAASGVPQPTISAIENGERNGSDATRVRIARALGVDPNELFPYREEAS